ncbi:ArnT family glycosyltransferase [Legionella brunensis]|uniref:Dolichyl-phosphate-mannose-protein mannosyltransferase n=1 Tax=Legionella brunensis TaxID=29422 RepID=A0A0W0S5K5_9GAMM|nr:glycosyltransferase family 39 protein [Legionella brunensis]KTC78377.1 dolichyl-phosphate-mannose-protein mannosyltransferase [Legionella brunensis]
MQFFCVVVFNSTLVSGKRMLTDRHVITHPYRNCILIVLALIVLSAGLGLRDPWPADEPRFTLIAKQMIESGEWLFPMRGGELYSDKPPLFMWGIAVGYLATGAMKVAFLLPSLLASLLTLILTWDLGRRLWNAEIGFLAALTLLFTVQFTLQAKTAQIDALLTLFTTLGMYGFLRFLLLDGGWHWYYVGWFSGGLGIITKGVGFLVILLLIPAIWTHLSLIRHARWSSIVKILIGPLVMLAAVSLWLLPMLWVTQHSTSHILEAYRNDILFHQTVTRYTHPWGHIKPVWYYVIQVIPIFWLPLSLLFPWLIRCWRDAIRQDDKRVILLLGYMVLVILFFSASPGKRGVYLTPVTPVLALLASPWVMMLLLNYKWPPKLLRSLSWFLVFIWFVVTCILFINNKLAFLGENLDALCGPLFLVSLGLLTITLLSRYAPLLGIILGLACSWLCYSILLYPSLNDLRSQKTIMSKIAERVPQAESLLIVGFKEQFLLFSHQPIWHYAYRMNQSEQARESASWIQAGPHRWILGPPQILASCFNLTKQHNLGHRHGTDWLLVNVTDLKSDCYARNPSVAPYLYVPKDLQMMRRS